MTIKLDVVGKLLQMSILDNGRGFDVQSDFTGHMGLQSMRERIQKIGGTLSIRSTLHQGTGIEVEVEAIPQPERNGGVV